MPAWLPGAGSFMGCRARQARTTGFMAMVPSSNHHICELWGRMCTQAGTASYTDFIKKDFLPVRHRQT